MPDPRANTRWSRLDAHRPQPWRQTTRCIFCGIEGSKTPEGILTKEHVYSNWARRFVPRTLKKFKMLRGIARSDRTEYMLITALGMYGTGKSSAFAKPVTMDGCDEKLMIALGQ